MSAKLLNFPQPDPMQEWRIEVNSREDDSATCTYIPAGAYQTCKEAYWLLWVRTTSIDRVPALVEKATQLLKREQAIKRLSYQAQQEKRYCGTPSTQAAGSPTPKKA